MSVKKFEVYTVCDKDDTAAVELYNDIDKNSTICLYVKKAEYTGDEKLYDKYFIRQSDASGGGDGYGGASQNRSTNEKDYYIKPECIVCDADGKTVLGYAILGSWSSSSCGSSTRYSKEIFLPLGKNAKHTHHTYSYDVYPFDGTSSEYSSNKYTKFCSD